MFFDANETKDDIEADICIVGAGPAGLAVASEFLDTQRSVCVLESDSVVLNDLEATGLPIGNDSRARGFGGTAKVWLGIWKPLTEDDLEPKHYGPYSGWPVSFSDLRSYYDRAAGIFRAPKLSDFEIEQNFFGSADLIPTLFYRIKKEDLDIGKRFHKLFETNRNISVYLKANVTKFSFHDSQIEKAEVRTLSGRSFQVRAKIFVLAAGGIENARLLMLSNLGNDNVGRFYMDHPKGLAGTIIRPSSKLAKYYFVPKNQWIGLVLSKKIRQAKQLLNSHILLEPVRTGFLRRVTSVRIRNFMEQPPSPENRVTLSDQKDALGLPKARVSWQVREHEQRSMREFHGILKKELDRLDLGTLESPLLGQNQDFPIIKDASHHMGTTRMGNDPKTSVVDANCKVWGLKNLFVAGSSVFPTGGYANPTATIAALAVKLADRLKDQIGN